MVDLGRDVPTKPLSAAREDRSTESPSFLAHPMELTGRVDTMRVWIHRRYVRALVAGLTLSIILGAALVVALQVRADVGGRAVLRFLLRSHSSSVELTQFVNDPRTLSRVEDLFTEETLHNPGGFVYAYDGALVFHPYISERAQTTRVDRALNRRLFPRLVRPYLRGELDALLGVFQDPEVRRRLEQEGMLADLESLEASAKVEQGELERRRLLRLAVRQIQPFLPGTNEPYQLTLGDKLRFYESHAPRGEYVGLFEVRGLLLTSAGPDPVAEELSRHGHFLSIFRAQNRLILQDHHRGEVRTYVLSPFELPNGGTGFRVSLDAV